MIVVSIKRNLNHKKIIQISKWYFYDGEEKIISNGIIYKVHVRRDINWKKVELTIIFSGLPGEWNEAMRLHIHRGAIVDFQGAAEFF